MGQSINSFRTSVALSSLENLDLFRFEYEAVLVSIGPISIVFDNYHY